MFWAKERLKAQQHANFLGDHESVFSYDSNVPGIVHFPLFEVRWEPFLPGGRYFILFYFISFAIPKYNNYNNYNYYHKAYMHKLTTHLSTRAIPQLPHKVMPTVILQVLFKKRRN